MCKKEQAGIEAVQKSKVLFYLYDIAKLAKQRLGFFEAQQKAV